VSGFQRIIREIHRRSMWQILGIYGASSWVILQVVGEIAGGLALPEWVQPLAIILLLLGLPVVLTTAFVQEGVRRGATRGSAVDAPVAPADAEARAEPPETPPGATGAIRAATAPTRTAGASGARDRWFTWRNALLGGAGAFALLGLVLAGWAAARSMGIGPAGTLVAKGVFEERAPVILADFESAGADTLLARAATEALRVDLGQSQVVTAMEPTQVSAVLSRMDRSPEVHLGLDLAREIAIREGAQAVIAGDIIRAGSGFVLSARVVSPGDGTELVSQRVNASSEDEILASIDELSKRLRERIGESLRSLGGDAPLARVTTPSLEALRKYSQAVRSVDVQGDDERGIALLEEAVALDSAFAMAWRKLGVVLSNRGQDRARQLEAVRAAYRHADRLTESERYWATATYFTFVEYEPERAITAYRNLLELHPTDAKALNNLGNRYAEVRDGPRALETYRRGVTADSTNSILHQNLSIELYAQGSADEALRTIDAAVERFQDNPSAASVAAELYAARGEYERASELNGPAEEAGVGSLFWRAVAHDVAARLAAVRGGLAESETRFRARLAAERERGLPENALLAILDRAYLDLYVRDDPVAGLRAVEAGLASYSLSSMDPYNRPYLALATFFAEAGRADRARELLAEMERETDLEVISAFDAVLLDLARGLIAGEEERLDEAIAAFRRADRLRCQLCGLSELARTYDRAGSADSALALYERWIETPAPFRLMTGYRLQGPTLERMAGLFDERGDLESAAKYYAMFVDLWADADEELQPRVRAAQTRLEEIMRERG